MFGLITQFLARPGQRDELARLIGGSAGAMPGCLSYTVALDADREDALWVTETWADEASHAAALALPAVAAAMKEGRSMVAGTGVRARTRPVTDEWGAAPPPLPTVT